MSSNILYTLHPVVQQLDLNTHVATTAFDSIFSLTRLLNTHPTTAHSARSTATLYYDMQSPLGSRQQPSPLQAYHISYII